MVCAKPTFEVLAPENGRVPVRLGDRTYSLNPQRAFFDGYCLMRAGQYEEAAMIFNAISAAGAYPRPSAIMLARCKAGLHDYEACLELLRGALAGEPEEVADMLHTAFVYDAEGMLTDAIRELVYLARVRPDLPTPCLLLGDLFTRVGMQSNAARSWKLAIERDNAGGAVDAAARKRLSELLREPQHGQLYPQPTISADVATARLASTISATATPRPWTRVAGGSTRYD